MPCQVTHMYLAGRLALHYSESHESDVIRDIHRGFSRWLEVNKNFREATQQAINNDSRDAIQQAMRNYRSALEQDTVAVFSAFAAGTVGPDLWVIPHEPMLTMAANRGITGQLHFDLGHYNLSHVFPRYFLRQTRMIGSRIPDLQRKYRIAYILGYLSHIALDIVAHIKVNVFAGAYFQLEKVWENEQGMIWFDLFNNHNKIEQYFDALIKFVCFEGYHSSLSSYDSLRRDTLNQPEPWYFPNYTDYYDDRLSFGLLGTNGINNDDEDFLDLSTSLPGPFAQRYHSNDFQKRIRPFVHRIFCTAYRRYTTDELENDQFSITRLQSEVVKMDFFRMDNDDNFTSQYYYLQTVIPDMEKIINWGTDFYDPAAFAEFILGGERVSINFIDAALAYLKPGDSPDETIFDLIHMWNLDIGMAIRINDIKDTSDENNPQKPSRPVLIDLINVIETDSSLQSWTPPVLDVNNWRKQQEFVPWDNLPEKERINSQMSGPMIPTVSGTSSSAIAFSQSGIDLRLSIFKLYRDDDELIAYIWGSKNPPGSPQIIPDDHDMYHIQSCIEDFAVNDEFAQVNDMTVGNAKLKEYICSFLAPIPADNPSPPSTEPNPTLVTPFGVNILPRLIRVSACRKYVCKPNDTGEPVNSGNFHASKFQIYENPFPSEEMAFAIFALIKRNTGYMDLFHAIPVSDDEVEVLKQIVRKGVNVILLIFSQKVDESTNKKILEISEAYIDGERQSVNKVEEDNPALIFKVEFEDFLFRTSSAVLLPDTDSYTDRDEFDADQDRISGLDVLQVAYVHAQENPDQKLIITGHTDRVGRDSFNIVLSKDRADAIAFLLEGNKEEWRKLVDRRHHDEDILQILRWVNIEYGWGCDPGSGSNPRSAEVRKKMRIFQEQYNINFIDNGRVDNAYPGSPQPNPRIGENGGLGPETWGAIFDVYQDSLAQRLDTTFENMPTFHTSLDGKWLEDNNKAVPCGETFPKDHPELDDYESAINRRVELLFFDPHEQPETALPCQSSEKIQSQAQALNRKSRCKSQCPIFTGDKTPEPLPVIPHARPQTQPIVYCIQHPDSSNKIPLDNLWAYLVYFKEGSDDLKQIRRLLMKEGYFCDPVSEDKVTIDGERETWFYFSHRDHLDTLSNRTTLFAKGSSSLPLIGSITVPCGDDAELDINIWEQQDWVIFRATPLDGERPDKVHMAESQDTFSVGYYVSSNAFRIYADYREKDRQEGWMGGKPIDLVQFGSHDGDPIWLGTLSALPSDSIKLLLVHDQQLPANEFVYTGSFNEIVKKDTNQEIGGHHLYNKDLLAQLLAIADSDQDPATIDSLPEPPNQFLLPGDICWQDQNGENACGAFSVAFVMNYWYPYTNNPATHDGYFFHKTENVPSIINGARTPDNIISATEKFNLHGRDNDCEDLDRTRAMKLVKLWLSAGVPVLVLIKEYHTLSSYHWKVIVGYDNNRILFNNSGADNEYDVSARTPGVNYDTAPLGNDIDSFQDFWDKWHIAGGDIVAGITSVNECTFIPLYPRDQKFAGDEVQ